MRPKRAAGRGGCIGGFAEGGWVSGSAGGWWEGVAGCIVIRAGRQGRVSAHTGRDDMLLRLCHACSACSACSSAPSQCTSAVQYSSSTCGRHEQLVQQQLGGHGRVAGGRRGHHTLGQEESRGRGAYMARQRRTARGGAGGRGALGSKGKGRGRISSRDSESGGGGDDFQSPLNSTHAALAVCLCAHTCRPPPLCAGTSHSPVSLGVEGRP